MLHEQKFQSQKKSFNKFQSKERFYQRVLIKLDSLIFTFGQWYEEEYFFQLGLRGCQPTSLSNESLGQLFNIHVKLHPDFQ